MGYRRSNYKKIVDDYLSGKKIRDIIKDNKISNTTLFKALDEYKVKRRGRKYNGNQRKIDYDKLVEDYKKGKKIMDIAIENNTTITTIYNALKKSKEPIKKRGRGNYTKTLEEKKEMFEYYKKVGSIEKVSEKYGVTQVTVRKYFRQLGVKDLRFYKNEYVKDDKKKTLFEKIKDKILR